jgi:RHS repeat-associated protein
LTYDAADNLIQVQTLLDATHIAANSYEYDRLNRQVESQEGSDTPATQRWVMKAYDAANNVTWVWDADGVQTTYRYDSLNRQTEIDQGSDLAANLQTRTTFVYDNMAVWEKITTLGITTFTYDRLGRLHSQSNNIAQLTSFWYDTAGNRVMVQDGSYPAWYDGTNIVQGTTPRIVTTQFAYDPLNRQYSVTDSGSRTDTYNYDALGRVTDTVDRDGRWRHFEYDAFGHLARETWSTYNGNAWVAVNRLGYAYDATDNLLVSFQTTSDQWATMNNNTWREHTYDVLNREVKDRTDFGTLTYTYDALGRATRVQDNSGAFVATNYDTAGRLASRDYGLATPATYHVEFTYHPSPGAPAGEGLSDRLWKQLYVRPGDTSPPMTLEQNYDNLGRVTSRGYQWFGTTNLELLTYTYDPAQAGLLTQEDRTGFNNYPYTKTYQYDSLGQLKQSNFITSVEPPANPLVTYNYDAAGNPPYPNQALAQGTVDGNRLPSDGGGWMKYDADGNLIYINERKPTDPDSTAFFQDPNPRWQWRFTYDHANHLVRAEWGHIIGGQGESTWDRTFAVDYTYDAEGKLVQRTETWDKNDQGFDEYGRPRIRTAGQQIVQRYLYDGQQVWADLDGANQVQSRYVIGLGTDALLARQDRDGSTYWYLTDRQNSVLGVARSWDGAWAKQLRYNGTKADKRWAPVPPEGQDSFHDRFEYTGRELDFLTTLQYNRARWLHTASGRFMSEDPLGFAAGDTNLYRYVGNSHPNATDPNGYFLNWLTGAIGAVVGGVIGGIAGGVQAYIDSGGDWDAAWKGAGRGAAQGAIAGGVAGLTFGAATTAAGALFGQSTVGTAAAFAAGGGASSMLGDAASQGFAISRGWQDGFSLERLGGAAIGGAVGGAVLGRVMRFTSTSNGSTTFAYRCGTSFIDQYVSTVGSAFGGGIAGNAATQSLELLSGKRREFDSTEMWLSGAQGLSATLATVAGSRFFKVCFAAGTPLLTPDGHKAIEEFQPGDLVLSADENDPSGPVEPKVVEEVFRRFGRLLNLHVGGRLIRTTGEHPFFVYDRGWTPAAELRIGELLCSHDGKWVAVEGLGDSGQEEVVYNLRVQDYHTYFVGSEEWGFSVWAHNAYHPESNPATRQQGEQFRGCAEALWGTLPQGRRYGATVAVSHVDGVEVVSLYANLGSGRRQFSQAQINRFRASVEDAGGVFIHTTGTVHAEQALHQAYPTAPAIGISNPNGPCANLCGQCFAPMGYYNLHWPGNRPAQW